MKVSSIIIILFVINYISSENLRAKEVPSPKDDNLNFNKISADILKKYLLDDNIYVIDTRKMSKSASGYIKNTILLPESMFSYMLSIIPLGSEIILITEEENKEKVIGKIIELFSYKLLGYAIFSEITANNDFDLQVVEYNPNLNENIQQIVDNGENIIDIREKNECKETGYIKNSKLIPLSTFLSNYIEIPKEGDVYIFCKSGMRAVIGMTFARRMGYNNRFIIMKGGMNKVIEEGFPLIPFVE